MQLLACNIDKLATGDIAPVRVVKVRFCQFRSIVVMLYHDVACVDPCFFAPELKENFKHMSTQQQRFFSQCPIDHLIGLWHYERKQLKIAGCTNRDTPNSKAIRSEIPDDYENQSQRKVIMYWISKPSVNFRNLLVKRMRNVANFKISNNGSSKTKECQSDVSTQSRNEKVFHFRLFKTHTNTRGQFHESKVKSKIPPVGIFQNFETSPFFSPWD